MKEKDIDNLKVRIIKEEKLERMDKMINVMGERENFEKFKQEQEGKSIEELLDELKKTLIKAEEKAKNFKPNVKILVETDEDGKGRTVEIKGNKPSVMIGLAELATELVQSSNLTAKDIRFAIETGIETANEEE